ncbi:hypothetical protein [Streptomyces sp. NPDC048111]|uniref:hypothetical protein n=1 Tax=Streptomyces sp. NPDC048111 TaxID=3365500 RepID=UPI0037157E7A
MSDTPESAPARPGAAERAPAPGAGSGPATPDITYTRCKRCGTELAGLDGRYSCGVCGWSNHWSEGHRPLPRAEDDPDAPPSPVNPLGEQ